MKQVIIYVVLLMAVSAFGGTNGLKSIEVNAVTNMNGILEIVVHDDGEFQWEMGITEDGLISVSSNLKADPSAEEIWSVMIEQFRSKESVVKTLAESGEICKVYGHVWRQAVESDFNPVVISVERRGTEICRLCGATKVTKTVTEIIPAKGKK